MINIILYIYKFIKIINNNNNKKKKLKYKLI